MHMHMHRTQSPQRSRETLGDGRPVRASQLLLLAVIGVAHAALLGWIVRASEAPGPAPEHVVEPLSVALVAPPAPPAPAPLVRRRPAVPREAPAVREWRLPPLAPGVPGENIEPSPAATAPVAAPAPAPVEPAPVEPAPVEPAPVEPASVAEPPPVVEAAPPPPPPPAPEPPARAEPRYAVALGAFPGEASLEFKVYSGEYTQGNAVGRARIRVESDAAQYRLRNEAELVGLISLFYKGVWIDQSSGRLGPDGPEPLRYSEWRRTKPERWVGVDYEGKRVVLASAPGGLPLTGGAQDRLSVLWLLGMVARANPELLAQGRVLEVPLLSFRGVESARFESRGNKVLVTEAGPLQTLHLAYRPRGAQGGGIEVWLGYDHQMQPVRIRYRESAQESYDMVLAP